MENPDEINPFALSRRIQCMFKDADKAGQVGEVVKAVESSKKHLPRYGECWNVFVDALYQQAEFPRAAIEAARGNFRNATTWRRTIAQTIRENVSKAGDEQIARAKEFLVKEECHQGESRDVNPREEKRIRDLRRATNQMYLRQIARDVEFMENLLTNLATPGLPEHTRASNGAVREILEDSLEKCASWKWQMHQRTPLYSRQEQRFLTSTAKLRATESHQRQLQLINRVKARRMAIEVAKFSKESPRKLLKYIEDVVCPFYTTISEKSFPELGEFVGRAMEAVGEAYIRDLIEDGRDIVDISQLLRIPSKANVTNLLNFTFKKEIEKLENHLKFVRYPLERAYIKYQIIRIMSRRLPEHHEQVRGIIERIMVDSRESGSPFWCFLCVIASAHLELILSNDQKTERHLLEALDISRNFPQDLAKTSRKILRQCHRNLLRKLLSTRD